MAVFWMCARCDINVKRCALDAMKFEWDVNENGGMAIARQRLARQFSVYVDFGEKIDSIHTQIIWKHVCVRACVRVGLNSQDIDSKYHTWCGTFDFDFSLPYSLNAVASSSHDTRQSLRSGLCLIAYVYAWPLLHI